MASTPRRTALCLSVVVGTLTALAVPGLTGLAGAAGLSAPTGLKPDNTGQDPTDPSTSQKDPVLSWSAVAGATSYRVEMALSNDWTDSTEMVTLPNKGVTRAPFFAPPQTLQHNDYFWRVQARSSAGGGPWSQDAQLYRGWDDAPTIGPNPGFNATLTPSSIATSPWRMSWSALPDASSYEFELSASPTFPQPNGQGGKTPGGGTTVCLTDHTTWTPYSSEVGKDLRVDECVIDFSSIADSGGTTYWRVRGIDDSEDAAPDGASSQTLDCFGVGQSSTEQDLTTVAALGTPSSAGQECSLWSNTGTVQAPVGGDGDADITAMGAPAMQLSCTTCTDMPEISWDPVTHADSYRVTIADDPQATSIQRVYKTPFLSLTPRDQLPDYSAGHGYYVFVQACTSATGAGQNAGCGTAARTSFKKVTPSVNGLSATDVPGAKLLTWNDLMGRYSAALGAPGLPAVEAENYRVDVTHASDPDFENAVVSTTVDRACDVANVGSCYQPSTSTAPGKGEFVLSSIADGDYIWRVVPIDLSGNRLPGSQSSVSVDTTSPKFHITNHAGFSVSASVNIAATESGSVGGVSGSSLHVVSATTGKTVAGTLTATSAKTWTFNPSGALATGDSYTLTVSSAIHDGNGNLAIVTGKPVRTSLLADDKSAGWSYKGWSKASSSQAKGGTYRQGASGHTASLHFVGPSVSLYACKGPKLGKLVVKVDGHVKTTRSEHASFTKCGVHLWTGSVGGGAHTLVLQASGGRATIDEARVS